MRKLSAFVVALAMVFGVFGCGEKKPATTGEKVEDAAKKAGEELKKAGEKAGEEVKKAGEEVKKAVEEKK